MKRDMDLVRKILLAMEAGTPVLMPGYDPDVVLQHVWLMQLGQLITITPKAQAFLDAVRENAVWAQVKTTVTAQGFETLPLALLQELALKILAEQGAGSKP